MPQRKDKENSFLITGDEIFQQRKINKDWQPNVDVDPNVNIAFSTPKTIVNTSPIDTANQTSTNTKKLTKLTDDKETTTLSHAFHFKAKAKRSRHK
ncbi:Uncharacterised protein [Candidatus Bartonella washoeensis]|uniref:Uncharacterized protein n=1 Tax=Candidatus Bartonella washoeensis Sb944nv TaxID=1094563 RepID=J1J544_9HYPH|nr:hypothetical protein [Bartonella washoeensis]EJF78835.1 hypothetical protein MCQ_01214 [Bartonella washoeensis Sb944nv]SPU27318.1 Uncharacterised protein [Bartonella washoeensis]